ncbi:cation:proton antiporter subunit C [Alphaproteobacteria bacterium KMM 3653]|uniref:Cation:proton antiporter subunit C n=1 Tax=Harenicola maris TaxID=2841044 RepID=A0AAP2CQJ0_9RHOB|nr:cation:proton antiporter subunit C [Harenicola maris]
MIWDVEFILGHMNYWLFIVLMMVGFYIVVAKGNLLKKIVGLNIFQVAVFMLYISVGKITGGTAPIFPADLTGHIEYDPSILYSNPLPHVLILTAIVVGVATTSLGLALIVRIREGFDSIEEDELVEIERAMMIADNAEHGSSMGGRA